MHFQLHIVRPSIPWYYIKNKIKSNNFIFIMKEEPKILFLNRNLLNDITIRRLILVAILMIFIF